MAYGKGGKNLSFYYLFQSLNEVEPFQFAKSVIINQFRVPYKPI